MKLNSENPGKHHDYYGIIDDDTKEDGLVDGEDFDGFHENEYVTKEADWRTMSIFMCFKRIIMLPVRLTSHIWMC